MTRRDLHIDEQCCLHRLKGWWNQLPKPFLVIWWIQLLDQLLALLCNGMSRCLILYLIDGPNNETLQTSSSNNRTCFLYVLFYNRASKNFCCFIRFLLECGYDSTPKPKFRAIKYKLRILIELCQCIRGSTCPTACGIILLQEIEPKYCQRHSNFHQGYLMHQ